MQEYLTGLSEQYSAFQTLMGQTAAIQQLQAAMTASAASQSASNTQALAQQAALAQYMQQVAAASGSSSSSSTSPNKNLNMLSNMAQLTNYQAMMSMMMGGSSGGHTASAPPRRGRGSRGGMGGSPRGRKVGPKVKRLDSGEFVTGQRGGRGSRGGGGGRGRKNTDYLYMMQSGSAELASQRSGGGFNVSPGSTPVHNVDDSETSSLASTDEQFYTEAYPNKLCAFCNLSEKSFLGQGDMVKYTINETTLKEYSEKRKKEGTELEESPSERSKSPNTLQSMRRKLKKFTSGDSSETPDELETIGFLDEVDVNLVFETGGVFYAHFNCALWSAGVSKAKEETAKESSSSPILKHVSEAVLKGLTTRCGYCKHYGATVPCKASGKFYHWPCAVASGCFMEKASLSMVSTDSYDKVAEVSPTAAYLYYTGEQWKIGKVRELLSNLIQFLDDHLRYSPRNVSRWLSWPPPNCVTCCTAPPAASTTSTPGTTSRSRSGSGAAGSVRSARHARTAARADTRTGKCEHGVLPAAVSPCHEMVLELKSSQFVQSFHLTLRMIHDIDTYHHNTLCRYLLCDVCDGAYHAYCLRPQMASVPKNGWKCKRCRRCTDCNSKTPGSGQSSRWHNNYSVCDSCYQQRNKVSV